MEREVLLRLGFLRIIGTQQIVELLGGIGGYIDIVYACDHVADLYMGQIGRGAGRHGKDGQITVVLVVLCGDADADILVGQRELILLILGSGKIITRRIIQ